MLETKVDANCPESKDVNMPISIHDFDQLMVWVLSFQ